MKLFVYGTLAPGKPNEHILKDVPGSWQKASVRGKLFPDGWGAALGFPGIVLNPAGETVQGLLFSSDVLDQHWDRLDEFEGEGYRRVVTPVNLEDGEVINANIYVLSEINAD